jgi:hypothetical protein
MAKEFGRNDHPADDLKAEIAQSRDLVAREIGGLRYELDIPRRIKRSFREQTPLWIGAALVVGTLFVMMSARKKKIYVDAKTGGKAKSRFLEAGFALGALRIAASLLKPIIANFITKKVGDYASSNRPAKKW